MITTTYCVRRWTRQDFSGVQQLERVTRVFGMTVWVAVIDSEPVPSWAAIQLGALGYTEWKSRLFTQYADLLNN